MKLSPMVAVALAALIAVPAFTVPAYAADQTILGSSFQAKNPGTQYKRKVTVKAREKASPNTIVGNPTVSGATLTIRVDGGSMSQQTVTLPASNWSGDATKGYKYKDSKRALSPVKSARLTKSGSGSVSLQAQLDARVASIDYPVAQEVTVLPPNPGSDACVLLTIGGGDSYSVKYVGGQIVNKGTAEYTHKKVTTEGTCVPACNDGDQNGNESDIDCGGSCPGCGTGGSCNLASDCASGVCNSGTCAGPTCTDGSQNGDETDIDCGGSCPNDCVINQGCGINGDCQSGLCSGSLCKCPNNLYTFTITSNVGGAFDSAEWPGGQTAQTAVAGCNVTVNRPNDNIDLACSLAAPFSVASFNGYSSCVGTGGEDGDGCAPLSCPFAGIGSCCDGRPSCSVATNGSGSANYFVQCLQ